MSQATGSKALVIALLVLYLLAALTAFVWLLLAVWFDLKTFESFLGTNPDWKAYLGNSYFRLFFYATVGGGLGAVLESGLSLLRHYADAENFSLRFTGKYLFAPWFGALLALLSYAVVRSGLGVVTGVENLTETNVPAMISAFALGGLAGFNSRQVTKWLYDQGKRIFPAGELVVPNVVGLTFSAAEEKLKKRGFKTVRNPSTAADTTIVATSDPKPGDPANAGASVTLT